NANNGDDGPAFNSKVLAAANSLPGATLTPSGDTTQHNPAQGRFRYHLVYDYSDVRTTPFAWETDLFTFTLSLQPFVNLHVEFDFGLNPQDGFFIVDNASATPEVRVSAGLNLPISQAGGAFGPFNYGVRNGSANITFALNLDLRDSDNTGGKIS